MAHFVSLVLKAKLAQLLKGLSNYFVHGSRLMSSAKSITAVKATNAQALNPFHSLIRSELFGHIFF